MSLCIAKIIDGELCINADSLLSGSGITRHNAVTDSVLKAILLTEKICLCFAGNPDYIDKVYEYLKLNPKIPLQPFAIFLHGLNKKSNGAIEFILSGYVNFDRPYIWEIKDGKVQSTQSSWIGSKKGFDLFQSAFLTPNKIKRNNNDAEHFQRAFAAVIEDNNVPEVGDFHFAVITVKAKDEHFKKHKFLNYRSIVKINATLHEAFGTISTIMKTESNTNFAMSYVPNRNVLKPCLGIFFGHVNYAMLFKPLEGIKPKIYSGVSGEQFKSEARKEGFELDSFPLQIAYNNFHQNA